MLDWTQDQHGAMAPSVMHDDGSSFMYEFEKQGNGWKNKTPVELITGPRASYFHHMADAKAWAEKMEKEVRKWAESTKSERHLKLVE